MKTIIPLYLLFLTSAATAASDLLLAQEYKNQNIINWAMSEKLDGVRAYWNGTQLISRQGYAFTPPPDYTRNFPPYPIDGELFSQRGQFEQISATVRSHSGNWSNIKLHVFDVPQAKGNLHQRLAVLKQWLSQHPEAPITIIPQTPVRDINHAMKFLKVVEAKGGEGIMLRHPNKPYAIGRSPYLLKLKSKHDAECTVTKHHEGKGKYAGKLGALSCVNQHGEFRIGSGFKDADRNNPPAIGSIITYRYRGFTQKGTPRFPTFLRVRDDSQQQP
ncbi:DNA ligase [Neisseria animaloris]|uniref:DNA ligase n=1 Tax=Neisseria animaloris TaxID=326522 RepID=UPI000D374B00|nr:DNA ligase [Neisseria animaloris]